LELAVEGPHRPLELADARGECLLGPRAAELRASVDRRLLELLGGVLDLALVAASAASGGDERDGAQRRGDELELVAAVGRHVPPMAGVSEVRQHAGLRRRDAPRTGRRPPIRCAPWSRSTTSTSSSARSGGASTPTGV